MKENYLIEEFSKIGYLSNWITPNKIALNTLTIILIRFKFRTLIFKIFSVFNYLIQNPKGTSLQMPIIKKFKSVKIVCQV